ncbi:MAG: hypothetical protein ABIO29_06845 [Sphingomicrobium sp.]
MKAALPILGALAMSACAMVPPPMLPPLVVDGGRSSATIGFGGRAQLNGIEIVPLRVVEDSRCPINARCVWAGRLVLETDVTLSSGSEQLRLNLELAKPVPVAGATLTLVDAQPGKLAGAEGNPPANRFTFEVTR